MILKSALRHWLLFLWLFCSLTACRQEEAFEQRDYPRLRETLVLAVEKASATFGGTVLSSGTSDIIDHGFIWRKAVSSQPDFKDIPENFTAMERISLGSLRGGSAFQSTVSYGLEAGQSYSVRAYLKTKDGYTVYGQPVAFVSQGSALPVITQIQPESAVWGDTLTITGTNFSYLSENITVFFDEGLPAKVLSATPTVIRCLVPESLTKEECKISIKTVAGIATSTATFKLDTSRPIIAGISPALGTFGETLTITGKNFSGAPQYWRVVFDYNYYQIQGVVTDVNPTEIKAVVPALDRRFSSVKLARVSSSRTIVSDPAPDLFQMKPPKIASVELLSSGVSKWVKVTGSGFSKPAVTFAGVRADADARVSTEFLFNPADGVFPRPTSLVDLKVTSAEQEDSQRISFTYTAPWVKRANRDIGPFSGSPGTPIAAFALQDNGYFLFSRDFYSPVQAYRYNPQLYDWQRLPDLPVMAGAFSGSNLGTVVIDDQAYILSGKMYESTPPTMWRYKPATNEWKEVKAPGLPITSNQYSNNRPYVMTGIGNKVYLLAGEEGGSLWEYSAVNDTWARKRTNLLPASSVFSGAFSVNGILYGVSIGQNQDVAMLYSYNPASDEWQLKTNFPFAIANATRQCTAYSSGQLGYIVSMQETVSYDPASNTIKRLLQNPGNSSNTYTNTILGFSYQKNAYLLNAAYLDFWEVTHN
ncbi:hypothetical protein GCM10023189_38610 [Nibrella saemangeumensis]|uniref:IPT/TIG domain-containing protein n=1 Tax=Nibrella saemangeumensis TaxID=1084526 RepID=A0ABP8NA67_9BACT